MNTQRIGAFAARRNFGEILDHVGHNGKNVIIEKNGKPIVAVVPIKILEAWEKDRIKFFDTMREMAQTANLSEEEGMKLALETVEEVRKEERKKKTHARRP